MATAGELLREANEFLAKGQLDEAADLFEQAHNADREQPNGAIGMAKVAILLGQNEDAMKILDAVLTTWLEFLQADLAFTRAYMIEFWAAGDAASRLPGSRKHRRRWTWPSSAWPAAIRRRIRWNSTGTT